MLDTPPVRRVCLRILLRGLVPVLLAALLPLAPARADDTRTFFWANAWHALGAGAASGDARMDRMTALIRRRHPSAGALAELMPSQWRRFNADMHGRYRLLVGSRQGLTNGVFYDPTVYRLVASKHFRSYYFFGQRVREPVAVLEDRQSAARVAVIAVHNPADLAGRSNARWRAKAIRAEVAEVTRMRRQGLSVLLAGDFNGGASVRRHLVTGGALVSAVPGPLGRTREVGIDQLFAAGVTLSGYRPITGPGVSAITNHRVVYTADYQVP